MIGDTHAYRLDPEDDNLHEPTSPDPLWTETFWLSFGIPERSMQVSIYPWFRRNIGMQAGGVLVWDARAELPWDIAFCEYDYHLPLDPSLDLRRARLANGLAIDCLETQKSYRVQYEHTELNFDLVFVGIMEPLISGKNGKPSHLDQSGRITGELSLRGERIEIDAPAMRDRSWAVRHGATRVAYAWGSTIRGDSFLCLSLPSQNEEPVRDGFLLREGKSARLTSGQRKTTRAQGHPKEIALEATDALGRRLLAHGTCVNRMAFSAYPGTFAWDSMVRWDFNGSEAWGEDQDVWATDQWRLGKIRHGVTATG